MNPENMIIMFLHDYYWQLPSTTWLYFCCTLKWVFSHIVWEPDILDFWLRIWDEAGVANETEKNDPLGNSRIGCTGEP